MRVKDAIVKGNRRWERQYGITVRGLAFSDLASSYTHHGPQARVNAEFFGQYDIYFGLMGHRFGSVTKEYGSGTEEEYRLAVEGHLKRQSPKFIAFGFSREPIDPFSLDPDQLKRVGKFRKYMEKQQLYYSWRSNSDFTTQVEEQLDKLVHAASQDPVIGSARYKRDPSVS